MKKAKDLLQRIIINGISLIILIFLISFANVGPFRWIFTGFVALIQAIALWEYFQLVKQKGLKPAIVIGLIASVLYVFASLLKARSDGFWIIAPEIILALSFFAFFVYYAFWQEQVIASIATTFLGIIYIAIPMALIVRITYFFNVPYEGSFWLIYLIAVTKSADTGAYFVGKGMGKIKLAERLSPNKTIEGAIGGLLASIIMSCILYGISKSLGIIQYWSLWEALLLGLVIGIAGQLGDLAESLLKRDAKVKDSNKIPAVGGILDMIDSILFTSPIIFIFLKMYA